MRALKTVAVAAVVVGLAWGLAASRPALASENYIGNMADGGNLTRCFVPASKGIKAITFQCPNQIVYVRAGNGSYADAGPGGLIVDFTAAPDSYPFPLATSLGQDRICLKRNDAGILECNFYQVAQ